VKDKNNLDIINLGFSISDKIDIKIRYRMYIHISDPNHNIIFSHNMYTTPKEIIYKKAMSLTLMHKLIIQSTKEKCKTDSWLEKI
jgi:hypothetical protein